MGLDFFGSIVATCWAGQLSQRDTKRFGTGFLEVKAKLVPSRPKRDTGQCGHHGLGISHLPLLGLLIPEWGQQRHGILCLDLLSLAQGLCPGWGEWSESGGAGLGVETKVRVESVWSRPSF